MPTLPSVTQQSPTNSTEEYYEVAERWMTALAGIMMIVASALGIVLNLVVFHRFVSVKTPLNSFYTLCVSKTISNTITLIMYFFYNGPASLFNTHFGPDILNNIVNQTVAYGIYAQGPMTQLFIAGNRFVVILFPAFTRKKTGKSATMIALALSWILSCFITVSGFPGNCTTYLDLTILTWEITDDCVAYVAMNVLWLIIFISVLSSIFNFVIAAKLIIASTQSYLDSTSSKKRKRRTRNLFLQNVFQDFVYTLDTCNGMFIFLLSDEILFQFMFTMFSNLSVPVVDGCIMLCFNYEKKKKPFKSIPSKVRVSTVLSAT